MLHRWDTPASLARQAQSSASAMSVRYQGASARVKCP